MTRRRRVLRFLVLILIAWGMLATGARTSGTASAESGGGSPSERPILVIVDLSNSMNEPDEDGKIKIQGAGEAFASLLPGFGSSTRLGVWTYPDNGDCGAGTLATQFTPVGGIDAGTITSRWVADGNTPTAAALRAAAETVAVAGGDTIILISDGESNCDADPCAAAADLAAEGINVRVHTVGFDISDQGDAELQCISSATGGTHTNVENSDELVEALAALSELSLRVDVTSEVLDDSTDTSFPSARVQISATVSNTGIRDAHDLDLTLRFNSERRPFLIDGTRTLPRLDAGSDHSTIWTFDVPIDCDDYELEYSALVRVRGELLAIGDGSIVVSGRDDSVYCLLTNGDVAILGDSYSSGEGAPPYDSGTNETWNRCRRGITYGRADRRDDEPDSRNGPDDPLRVVACSGAIIHDLLVPQGEHQVEEAGGLLPAQLDQLRSLPDDVDVVVLTISGNDIGFATVGTACAVRDCVEEPSSLDDAEEAIASLQKPLGRALRILESTINEGRDAPVQFIVLPYVDILSGGEASQCVVDIDVDLINYVEAAQYGSLVGAVLVAHPVMGLYLGISAAAYWDQTLRIDPQETSAARKVSSDLNNVLRTTVAELHSENRPVYFAGSVESALEGHTLCSEDPWVHGIRTNEVLSSQVPWQERPSEVLHPTAEGYRAIWRALLVDARGWPILGREVSDESSVGSSGLCPAGGSYRRLSYNDFWSGALLELERGECIVVVGRTEGEDPGWSPSRLATTPLTATIGDAPDGSDSPLTQVVGGGELRSWIAFYIQSTPELLGVARPDENGEFQEILWIPDDLPTGRHTLMAIAPNETGALDTFKIPVVLVDEPTGPYKIVFAGALAAILIGTGILVLVPRGPRSKSRRARGEPLT